MRIAFTFIWAGRGVRAGAVVAGLTFRPDDLFAGPALGTRPGVTS
jgi:hypothetical protein